MRSCTINTSLTLAALVSAVPITPANTLKLCSKSYFTGFEKVTAGTVDIFSSVPTPFHGLAWPGFTTLNQGLISNVHAQSPKSSTGFSIVNNILHGTPQITSIYPGSTIKHFTMRELFLGCILVDPVGAHLAESCTVLATGTQVGGNIVTATLTFDTSLVPVGLPLVSKKINLQQQTLPNTFTNLERIDFSVTKSVLPATIEGLLDSFKYDTYHEC